MDSKYNMELYKLKAQLCKTFTDPLRLIIIEELNSGEKPVGELVETLGVPQAVVSRHLAVLRNRGVVKTRREGTNIYYRITDPKICDACGMVHRILIDQIESNRKLAKLLTK